MGAPFSDITLYLPTPHIVGTPEYYEEVALENFVSDLYVQNMHGYKPPKTSRITIQPAFHDTWNRTWKIGSIVAIAPYFNYDEYSTFDKKGKYKHILDLIQTATIALSDEYGWDKTIFDTAYRQVLDNDFKFKIDYPVKHSRDKKKTAKLIIEKTETVTSVFVNIQCNESSIIHKLFEKKNAWWYDCAYILARHNKWFDTNRFGIGYGKKQIDIWYSLDKDQVEFFEKGKQVKKVDFGKHFMFN